MRPWVRSPIVNLDRSEPLDTGCQVENVAATECRDGPASCRIVSHGDRTAREDDDDHPQSTLPPLTLRISPVMCRARFEHRNTIGPAMSRGAAIRRSGIPAAIRSRPPLANGSAHISVSTQPGATLFTVMPRAPSSGASDLTNEITAPFEAA